MAENAAPREAHDLETANAIGLLGVEVDPTPDSHYTVAGVLAGKPVPESDPDAAAAAGRPFGQAAAPPRGTATATSSSSSSGPSAKELVAGMADASDDELAELANDNRKTVSEAAKAEQARRAEGGAQ